jgi:hypothetical protein
MRCTLIAVNRRMLMALGGAVVVAVVAFLLLRQNDVASIQVDGIVFEHVEHAEVGPVNNHFFSPGGKSPRDADRYIQISDFSEASEAEADVVARQVVASFNLEALDEDETRYFGMFRGRHPVYGLRRDRRFWLYVVQRGFEGDEDQLRDGASDVLDRIAAMPRAKL